MTVESTSFPSELNKNVVIQKKEDMARDRGSWEIFGNSLKKLKSYFNFYKILLNFTRLCRIFIDF